METIRYTERRRTTKLPAILVMCFLILGGSFVAYAIKNEDNPRMLGFAVETETTDVNGLEEVEQTETEKLEQAMNLNYEVKEVSSIDKSTSNFSGDIHLPTLYVDGKEVTDLNVKIQNEYTNRFDTLKKQMSEAEGNYSFNVTYTYHDNIIGIRKVVSILIKQQIIDEDSKKITSEKLTTYNIDLSSKNTLTQNDVLLDILGKDYKTILKDSVKNYVISQKLETEANYKYEITGLENFYIKESKFHIVFNNDSDNIASKANGVVDIEIEN